MMARPTTFCNSRMLPGQPYCCTQQYSVVALTDSSGAIVERYAYDAYDAYGGLSVFDGSGAARTATSKAAGTPAVPGGAKNAVFCGVGIC